MRRALLGLAGTAASVWSGAGAPPARDHPIIDTHTHFYDPQRPQGVPWPPKDDKLLYRTLLPADYHTLPKPAPVAGTVVVEASPWVEDNQWILDLAAKERFIVGLVGNLPVGGPEFGPLLKRFAANPLFRGIRVSGSRLKEGLAQPAFLADLRQLAAADLALDVVGGPDLLGEVARLASIAPALRIIIDHLAGVRIDAGEPNAAWQAGMREAARPKNVFAKVSGLTEATGLANGAAPRKVDYYRPVLDVLSSAFGPDRLVYGSNWPVCERFAPLGAVQQLVQDYFHDRGAAATEAVFSRNAAAAYKWVKR